MEEYKNIGVTVFTPTYNRKNTLPCLYESLRRQTNKDFEWLVVDDGSTDGTESLFTDWMKECDFPIHYVKQTNGGKHRAVNHGVNLANGKYFFIVDSDDYLCSDAIEWITTETNLIEKEETFAGICGLKVYENGNKIGGGSDFGRIDANALDIRYKYHVKGDLAEIFKTFILRKYPFPEIEGEKFCTEALVWNRIAQQYKLRYIYKSIYICEYLEGGLSDGSIRIRRHSPIASIMFYGELFKLNIPFLQKAKAWINLWRFTPKKMIGKSAKLAKGYALLAFLTFPLGRLYRLKDTLSLNKRKQ